jgi:hypothetical protein
MTIQLLLKRNLQTHTLSYWTPSGLRNTLVNGAVKIGSFPPAS